jgi:cyanophycinase-like exopeptidase
VNISSAKATPGKLAILGSGETTGVGRRVLRGILQELEEPRAIAVLDTPAGFQPNHAQVAGKVAQFILEKLADLHPHPHIVETPKDGLDTPVGAAILSKITNSRCIVAGPGSPTYMIRKLKDTLYLDAIRQAHQQGSAIYISSAASIAFSAFSIPVYEIFKVGEDPYWFGGLDLLGPFGMRLAIVPHWNNSEGGAELDTRFSYMGKARFEQLCTKLPSGITILGIDEHTACIMDFAHALASIDGKGGVHIVRDGYIVEFASGDTFPMSLLGADPLDLQGRGTELPTNLTMSTETLPSPATTLNPSIEEDSLATRIPPQLIDTLLAVRTELRDAKQWVFADKLRDALTEFGIVVQDTPDGTRWSIPEEE